MDNLWAPWRIEYILGKREPYCIFCPEGNGLSDAERDHPPAIGSWVTYRYNGMTTNGIPRFARYLRIRDELPPGDFEIGHSDVDAAVAGVDPAEVAQGMAEKSAEFKAMGGKVYVPVGG